MDNSPCLPLTNKLITTLSLSSGQLFKENKLKSRQPVLYPLHLEKTTSTFQQQRSHFRTGSSSYLIQSPKIWDCGCIVIKKQYKYNFSEEADVYGKFLYRDSNDQLKWEFIINTGITIYLHLSKKNKLPNMQDNDLQYQIEQSKVIILHGAVLFKSKSSRIIYFHIKSFGACNYLFTMYRGQHEPFDKLNVNSIDYMIREIKSQKELTELIRMKAVSVKEKRKNRLMLQSNFKDIITRNKNITTTYNTYITNGLIRRKLKLLQINSANEQRRENSASNTARIILRQNKWDIKRQMTAEKEKIREENNCYNGLLQKIIASMYAYKYIKATLRKLYINYKRKCVLIILAVNLTLNLIRRFGRKVTRRYYYFAFGMIFSYPFGKNTLKRRANQKVVSCLNTAFIRPKNTSSFTLEQLRKAVISIYF